MAKKLEKKKGKNRLERTRTLLVRNTGAGCRGFLRVAKNPRRECNVGVSLGQSLTLPLSWISSEVRRRESQPSRPVARFAPRLLRFSSSRRLGYTPRESITCILFMMEGPRFPLRDRRSFVENPEMRRFREDSRKLCDRSSQLTLRILFAQSLSWLRSLHGRFS